MNSDHRVPLLPSSPAPGAEFVRLCKFLLCNRDGANLADIAAAQRLTPRIVAALKAAVPAGSLADPSWAGGADFTALSMSFIESLRQFGVFDGMLPSVRRIPLRTRISAVTIGLVGDSPAEGRATELASLTLSGGTMLEPTKAQAMIVVTDELARTAGPAAMDFLAAELRRGVVATTDKIFLDGVLAGVSPTGSAGSSAANVLTDLDALLAGVNLGVGSRPFFLFLPATAKKLATKNSSGVRLFPNMTPTGGEICGVPALVSDQLGSGVAALIDANGIAADTDIVGIDRSTQTTLEFDSAPTSASTGGSPPTPSPTQQVNLWQTGNTALRAQRYFGFRRLRDSAVARLSGVSY